jgi:regulator of protease activity HflC (stomatin/prohibitin superfamily)
MNVLVAASAPILAASPVPIVVAAGVALFVLILLMASIRMVREFERAVVFRLGRCVGAKGPGLFMIIPFVDKTVTANMQILAVPVTPQSVITKDNVTVSVDAVAFFQIVDPVRSTVQVNDWYGSSQLVAQTTLRSVVGRHELDQLLAERDRIDAEIQSTLDEQTAPWGVKVHRVEIRDVGLPEQMQRAMARQAEAERERRAKVIAADGEFQASKRLAEAANVIATAPGALQLRQLQTLTEISVANSSTIVFPIPMELFGVAEAIVGSLGGRPELVVNPGAGPAVAGGSQTTQPSVAGASTDAGVPVDVDALPDVEVDVPPLA